MDGRRKDRRFAGCMEGLVLGPTDAYGWMDGPLPCAVRFLLPHPAMQLGEHRQRMLPIIKQVLALRLHATY